MIELINSLEKEQSLTLDEYEFLIENRTEETAKILAEKAVKKRKEVYGNDVYIRGLVEIGNIIANADANSTTSQRRYKDCEASHNYFEGDATHYPNCIGFGGAFA